MGFCVICCFQTCSNTSSLNKILLPLSLCGFHQGLGENSILFLSYSEVPRPQGSLRREGQTLCVSGTEKFLSPAPKQRPKDPTALEFPITGMLRAKEAMATAPKLLLLTTVAKSNHWFLVRLVLQLQYSRNGPQCLPSLQLMPKTSPIPLAVPQTGFTHPNRLRECFMKEICSFGLVAHFSLTAPHFGCMTQGPNLLCCGGYFSVNGVLCMSKSIWCKERKKSSNG